MASAEPSATMRGRRQHPTPVARRAEKVSHGKTLNYHGAAAGFTRARDGRSIGRPRPWPGCPTALALYPISVRRPPALPPASSPPRIAATQLPPCSSQGQAFGYRFRSLRPEEDFHLQVLCHAWHTVDPGLRRDDEAADAPQNLTYLREVEVPKRS